MEKWPFFDQNRGLRRLEKSQLVDFFNFLFLQPGKAFFFLEYRKTHFPGLHCLKKKEMEKWSFLHVLFFGNIAKENVFYDILGRQNAYLGYKNRKLKKVEKLRFFQRGQPMVLVKKCHFFIFFFLRQFRPGRCVSRYSRTKKRLSRL